MKLTLVCFLIATGICLAENTNITIVAHGVPALGLAVPQPATVTSKKEKTEIKTKEMTLYIWAIPTAKTVDEGSAQIPDVIAHEVVQFVATTTNTITVAGSVAKQFIGRGVEADDYDPGTADVIVFTTGKAVFAACVHGEGNEAVRVREPMLAVLKTAKSPGGSGL